MKIRTFTLLFTLAILVTRCFEDANKYWELMGWFVALGFALLFFLIERDHDRLAKQIRLTGSERLKQNPLRDLAAFDPETDHPAIAASRSSRASVKIPSSPK